ncbi:30S ribosomal protein S20 [bacterium BMS3Bbin06]|nr:30S ribosomal protein S20 [bacterium BMS3Abin08]GBE33815.1 30S ribosomal protein S20 [bacterium BMS3Bbin06]HDY72076.1 30S ribosomal protein S20 [Nitrospirota bacterium]
MVKKNLSALKRVRQADKRALRNRAWKSRIKTIVKKVDTAVGAKDAETAQDALKEAIKVISKASSKGIIHRNTASRKISRLMKKVTAAFRSEAA